MSDYVKDAVRRGIRFADESGDGVWRTVNGRKIFIKEGEDVKDAMKRTFKKNKKGKNRAGFNKFPTGEADNISAEKWKKDEASGD